MNNPLPAAPKCRNNFPPRFDLPSRRWDWQWIRRGKCCDGDVWPAQTIKIEDDVLAVLDLGRCHFNGPRTCQLNRRINEKRRHRKSERRSARLDRRWSASVWKVDMKLVLDRLDPENRRHRDRIRIRSRADGIAEKKRDVIDAAPEQRRGWISAHDDFRG